MFKPTVCASILIPAILLAAGCSVPSAAAQDAYARNWAKSPVAEQKAFKTIEDMQAQSDKTKRLTSEQVATVATFVNSPNILVRLAAMSVLRNAGPAQAPAAEAVARKGLMSLDSMTRVYALTTLDRLNAPDTVATAQRLLADPSRYVATEAHQILARRGLKS